MTSSSIIAILGPTNVGKSTLLNQLIGEKISIVAPKKQTTRTRITGVLTEGETQLVFLDTPGIFMTPSNRLERAMLHAAWESVEGADQILLVVDAERGVCPATRSIVEQLEKRKRSAILVINKVDAVSPVHILPTADRLHASGVFSSVWMVSALSGDGVADLKAHVMAAATPGPWWYDEGMKSDLPLRLLASEITREKVILALHKELPYITKVETEHMEEQGDRLLIHQAIFVMKDGQKGIVLGKQGARIKEIGTAAREELSTLLKRKVSVYLFVKIDPRWMEKSEFYHEWGLRFD